MTYETNPEKIEWGNISSKEEKRAHVFFPQQYEPNIRFYKYTENKLNDRVLINSYYIFWKMKATMRLARIRLRKCKWIGGAPTGNEFPEDGMSFFDIIMSNDGLFNQCHNSLFEESYKIPPTFWAQYSLTIIPIVMKNFFGNEPIFLGVKEFTDRGPDILYASTDKYDIIHVKDKEIAGFYLRMGIRFISNCIEIIEKELKWNEYYLEMVKYCRKHKLDKDAAETFTNKKMGHRVTFTKNYAIINDMAIVFNAEWDYKQNNESWKNHFRRTDHYKQKIISYRKAMNLKNR